MGIFEGISDFFNPSSDKKQYNKYKEIVKKLTEKQEMYEGQFRYLDSLVNDVYTTFEGNDDCSDGEMVFIVEDAIYLSKRQYMELLTDMNSAKIKLGKRLSEAKQKMNYYKQKSEEKD